MPGEVLNATKFGNPSDNLKDPVSGGLADRPGDAVDVFHTNFGIAGLSLLGVLELKEVDPVYCMPRSITRSFGEWRKN